ncbi:MAG TPA: TetR/AcrR family transcriptional regulator [Lysobacter sp.]|nr:TetR/AcrR family transcriptional regulator [Lysobacter sp.]
MATSEMSGAMQRARAKSERPYPFSHRPPASPMPKRPAPSPLRPVRQDRSLRTQQRILAAMEALLADPQGGEITMERLADHAHVSIGAIYKRFQGKDSLLPLVLERVQDQQFERLREFLALPGWSDAGLAQRIHALLEVFAESQQARQRLIRALVVGHWQSDDRAPMEARSVELIATMHAWLSECAQEIRHPDPRLALSLGLFTTLQTLQTAVLFDRVPPALGLPAFVAEMARMFQAYLGVANERAPLRAAGPHESAL